jgi:tetratricopeptide (TPR) repeat protein
VAQLELGKIYWDKLHQVDKAADAFAKLIEALDDKSANRLTPADQKHILGGDETSAAASYLDFGMVFLAAKRYDLAIKAFQRGLVYDEDDPQLPLKLAEALLQSGKGSEALTRVEDYLKRQPQGAEGYDLLAKILTELHREGEITPRLEALAKVDSKNILLQYALADRYREIGQAEKAEQMYKALLAAQPTTQGYGALAASLYKRKKTDELLRVMTEAITKQGGAEAIAPQLKAIEGDPAYADEVLDAGLRMLGADPPGLEYKPALIILAHIAGQAEKFDKLVALQRFVLKQNPSPLVYREIADTLYRMHKYGEAAATLEQLMAKYPEEKNSTLLVALAGYRRAAEQNEAALEAARQALKIDPTDVGAQVLSIQLLSLNGKLDEAVEIARNVLKDDPSNPDFNRLLGYILNQFGRTNEAIALYRSLLERYPNNREVIRLARSGLSVAYVTLGDYAKGEAELETLLQLDPDEPGVNNDLGYLYADQGKNLEKAESMIRKAVQEEPDTAAYLDSLGWVLFKRGKIKDAVDPLEKAVQNLSSGGDSTIYEHLGDVYFQLQEIAKAKDAWEKAEKAAVKAIPTDKRLPEIRKKLETLKTLGATPKPASDDSP